jgi:hypothetical protein
MNLQAASVPACKPPVTGRFSVLPEYSLIPKEHSGKGSNNVGYIRLALTCIRSA